MSTPETYKGSGSKWPRRALIGLAVLILCYLIMAVFRAPMVLNILSLVVVIVGAFILLSIALWVGDVAWAKGRSRGAFILFALLVPLVSWVVVATMTPLPNAAATQAIRDDVGKVCPQCAETIKAAAVKCRFCGYEFAPAPP